MIELTEMLILDTIERHGSIMPLFKSGYSYSKIIEWVKELEIEGKVDFNSENCRVLTKFGKVRLKEICENQKQFLILPLNDCKVKPIDIDKVFLP